MAENPSQTRVLDGVPRVGFDVHLRATPRRTTSSGCIWESVRGQDALPSTREGVVSQLSLDCAAGAVL